MRVIGPYASFANPFWILTHNCQVSFMENYHAVLDFSNGRNRGFPYRGEQYRMAKTPEGWVLERYCSRHDFTKSEMISRYFQDPHELVKTATINNITVEDIIRYHEYDMFHYFRYEYNHGKFLADVQRKVEYEFRFRDHEYYIDYWGSDPLATWIPGWIFTNDLGKTLPVNEGNFKKFISRVNDWMEMNEGISLQEMFDTCYKTDNTGELQIICINGTGHEGLADP
jgi:hypothetical protein